MAAIVDTELVAALATLGDPSRFLAAVKFAGDCCFHFTEQVPRRADAEYGRSREVYWIMRGYLERFEGAARSGAESLGRAVKASPELANHMRLCADYAEAYAEAIFLIRPTNSRRAKQRGPWFRKLADKLDAAFPGESP